MKNRTSKSPSQSLTIDHEKKHGAESAELTMARQIGKFIGRFVAKAQKEIDETSEGALHMVVKSPRASGR